MRKPSLTIYWFNIVRAPASEQRVAVAKDNESARKGGVTNGWMSGRNSDRMGRKSEFGAARKLGEA